jgi:hypothetical protein
MGGYRMYGQKANQRLQAQNADGTWSNVPEQRIAELEAENNRLRAFAESVVLLGWTSSDDFAADVQEAALKANLIQTVPGGYDPEKHGPSDYCDPGDEYYEFTFPAGGE